ncbi:MAG: response regulator [Acidobacteria bacterium]|nr:response regulator [Acidobacteriota bacterium]
MSSTILLADDSLTIQKVVELTFADTEYEVVTVSSGDELLDKLPTVQPDVVICDVIMPGTDGYSVCQTIKSDASTLHIPVILLTGTFEPFDKERALAAGCDEIITKPFEARNLVATVQKLLSGEAGEVTAPPPPSDFEGTVRRAPEPAQPPAEEIAEHATFSAEEEPDHGDGSEPAEPASVPPSMVAEAPAFEPPAPEAPEPEEGMDFTTTGFAEMEAAGQKPRTDYNEVPDEGLEFKIEDVESSEQLDVTLPEREPEPDVFSAEPPGAPASESPGEWEGREAGPEQTEREYPFGEPASAFEAAPEEARPVTAPIPIPEFPEGHPEEGPLEEAPGSAQAPGLDSESADLFAVDSESQPPDDASTQLFTQSPLAQPPAPEPEAPEETPEQPMEEAPDENEEELVPEPIPEPGVIPAENTPPTAMTLSDEDIEKIARRVVELAADKLERIAWEVIPDMAELIVRQRIREIEAGVDHAEND